MAYVGNAPAAGIIDGGNVKDGSITNADLAAGVAVANLGYTPVNKAGDTMTGQMFAPGINLYSGVAGGFGASKFLMQQEDTINTRGYACGPNSSTYGQLQLYRATSTGSPLLALGYDQSGRVYMPSQPCFYAYGTGGQIYVNAGIYGTMPFNTAMTNVGNNFNTSTYTFTAPVAGVYQFNTSLAVNSSNGGPVMRLLVNGSVLGVGAIAYNVNYNTATVIHYVNLSANDSVTARAETFNSAAAYFDMGWCSFSGRFLG